MYIEELFVISILVIFVVISRNYKGDNLGKYFADQIQGMYEKFAPYSFNASIVSIFTPHLFKKFSKLFRWYRLREIISLNNVAVSLLEQS